MKLTDNTILITGGGSGIGRGMAESFHKLGNKVIIAGRRQQVLDETTAANPGMESMTLDVESPEGIREFAAKITAKYPALNVLINNAGLGRAEDLKSPPEDSRAETMITTNILGPIRLISAFMPQLLKQPHAAIVNVSSGLGFVPHPEIPTYSATKAFVHSYSESLRVQLKGTPVQVIEIIPPYVQTEFGGPSQAVDPRAMPLKDFIAGTMENFKDPDLKENRVAEVDFLRFAESKGQYDQALGVLSEMHLDGRHP